MTTADAVNQAVDGWTIPRLLRHNAQTFPDSPALTSGIDPAASTLTWSELRAEIAAVTRGLAEIGLGQRERMLIAMSKRPEHWIVDLAAAQLGALSCTTYDTLSTAQIRFIAEHSSAAVVVLEGAQQLERWRGVLPDLPHLRAVILLDSACVPDARRDDALAGVRLLSFADLRGSGLPTEFQDSFERLTDAVSPEDPLAMVYTSGTTGDPKGVVLSHRNVIHEAMMQDLLVSVPERPRSVSYLPLAHIAERVLGIYLPICNAGHVTICADQERLLATLHEVRPHGFFGVPRVWEKLVTGLRSRIAQLSEEDGAAVARAREVALEVFRLRASGADVPVALAEQYERLDARTLRPLRAGIGLDQCVRASSGAAPIPVAVLEFLASIGLFVYEVWGLSETTGAATVSTPDAFTLGGVGPAGPGMDVRTAADGELFVRGPVVFLGYLRADGTIAPATDPQGWLPTGDIGELDEREIVSVTDRKKELIITAGGKNIAPTRVESLLRAHPLLSHAVAIGDGRRYITALLVLDEETAPSWAKSHGIETADLAELAAHPDLLAELDDAVASANDSLAHAEQVKTFRVVGAAWTAESGELTPKLSLRRRVIEQRYSAEIEAMYQ